MFSCWSCRVFQKYNLAWKTDRVLGFFLRFYVIKVSSGITRQMVLKSFLRRSAEERPEQNGNRRNLMPGPNLLLRPLLSLSGDHDCLLSVLGEGRSFPGPAHPV